MSISVTIKEQIKTSVQSCASVQQVYGYEENNPAGFPAVFIKTTNMDGEFSSTAENSRVYAYSVMILFPVGEDMETPKTINRMEYAENVVATVIDEIINAVDTNIELGGSPVLYVEAADVEWGDYTYEGGVAKAANITLRVYTEKTVV